MRRLATPSISPILLRLFNKLLPMTVSHRHCPALPHPPDSDPDLLSLLASYIEACKAVGPWMRSLAGPWTSLSIARPDHTKRSCITCRTAICPEGSDIPLLPRYYLDPLQKILPPESNRWCRAYRLLCERLSFPSFCIPLSPSWKHWQEKLPTLVLCSWRASAKLS